MISIFSLSVVILFLYLINYLLIEKKRLASDQSIHILFINLIKRNHHKFISECNNFLIQTKVCYPLLLHWFLSFFSRKQIESISNQLAYIVNIGSYLAFTLFLYLTKVDFFSDSSLYLLVSLIFILTPFTFNVNNAKNMGISARGIGLVLGQVYTYGLTYFLLSGNYWGLLVSMICALLILMSSQFASQYILFISPLLSLFSLSGFLILPLIGAILIYFLMMPKVAYQFFEGNIGHKVFYSRYLAKKLLLSYRPSIWKDVFWDIWVLILKRKSPKGGGTLFMYIYTNPLVILIFSIPLALPMSICILSQYLIGGVNDEAIYISAPIFFSVLLFFIFSFRKTRFLGEPERYVEFTIGFQAYSFFLVFQEEHWLIYSLLFYELFLVIAQVMILKIREKVKSSGLIEVYEKLDQCIIQEFGDTEVKLLSNNTDTTRLLTNIDRKVFYGSLYSEWYGRFHYTELYETFDKLKSEMVLPLIKEFQINAFILDTNFLDTEKFDQIMRSIAGIKFEKITEEAHLILFKVHDAI